MWGWCCFPCGVAWLGEDEFWGELQQELEPPQWRWGLILDLSQHSVGCPARLRGVTPPCPRHRVPARPRPAVPRAAISRLTPG